LDNFKINNLLVPLDGSTLAESVLPVVGKLAKKINASVTFIHVVEKDAPEKIHGEKHLTAPDEAEKYLKSIAAMDYFSGISIHIHVHETSVKDVSQSIFEHVKELNQDLVVMCTHGSSGFHGMFFGSIAQQVISLGNVPVLLIRPGQKKSTSNCNLETFLIPLDGNPEHEHVLHYASVIAKMCGAAIHLLIAVPDFGSMSGLITVVNRILPGTTSKMMDMIVPDAKEYLKQLQEKLILSGIKTTFSISRNNPAKAISDTAKKVKADLIVLATHGTKGAEAFWEGSVTPKISKSCNLPLLLVSVRK
jgi:nucleotide-binding universal stress UspA family protein